MKGPPPVALQLCTHVQLIFALIDLRHRWMVALKVVILVFLVDEFVIDVHVPPCVHDEVPPFQWWVWLPQYIVCSSCVSRQGSLHAHTRNVRVRPDLLGYYVYMVFPCCQK